MVDADPAAATLQIRDRHDRTTAEPAPGPVIGADGAGSALRQALQRRDLLQSTEEPLDHDYKELHDSRGPRTAAGRSSRTPCTSGRAAATC